MSVMEENKRRKSGSGRFGTEQKCLKEAGKAYKTRKLKNVAEKALPTEQITCKCKFSCKDLEYAWRKVLFEKFYNQNSTGQGSYLMNLIHLGHIKRRRHGTYEDPVSSKRQVTIGYTIPTESGNFVSVCKATFMNIFAVTRKKLDILVAKKKAGETFYSDKRTCHKKSKFSENDREAIRAHINLIPRDVGHYTRTKSDKEYLSPDLNVNRLFRAFQKRNPETPVTYKFYRSVFIRDFPKLSFRRPRMDTCHTCDRLDCEVRANIGTSAQARTELELHQRRAERARDIMKEDTCESLLPGSQICCLSMDLEQVMFVPTLVHSDMFYLSQLSCYNFGIHVGDTNTAYMSLWHEGVAGRGANEIASCLLRFLNSGFTDKRSITLWCDNCGGQNRNKYILFVLIFLVAHGLYDLIEIKFLTSGHSFMSCDRDIALIEKRKRVMKSFIPDDLINVIQSARYNPPFEVIKMTDFGFWDIKGPADLLLNTSKLQISKAVRIRIERDNPINVKTKTVFSETQQWTETNILKKCKTMRDLMKAKLLGLPSENRISENKKKSLRSMLPYLSNPLHQDFYKELLGIQMDFDVVEDGAEAPWHSLIHNLANSDLEKLQDIFKRRTNDNGEEVGINKEEFLDAICYFHGGPQYSLQSNILFDEINKDRRRTITWNMFLDFLKETMFPKLTSKLTLDVKSIEKVADTKNESIAKIVLIETDQYFCYAIILKHGRVGLYDGNLNFLTSYHAIMTREDLTRPEDERRRRNRWITDAIFFPDVLMFVITNTARSIMIYEASGLNHVPYWLILSTPNILECLSYKPYIKNQNGTNSQSILFSGDCYGEVMSFTFLQPKSSLLRRKRTDNITLFYWEDLIKEKAYVIVKNYGKVHEDSIRHIKYYEDYDILLTCSKDSNSSVIVKHIENKKKSVFYKVPKGVSCFALSTRYKLLLTGTSNGTITLWNIFIAKPVAMLSQYQVEIIDLQILENQELFISCATDGILKLWDLKEYSCLQTIKLKFPSFRIHGKLIEWGINCIYPGPKRKHPDESCFRENKRECFGIGDINEMKIDVAENLDRKPSSIWERSYILVTCCNYIAKLKTNFNEADIEYSFTYPVLSPPPLQNSVLIPSDWGLQDENIHLEGLERQINLNIEKQLKDLEFILNKNILEEEGNKSNINYKIAILESKKEQMRSKVALGAPYLALDLHEIPELKLRRDLPVPNKKKNEYNVLKIKSLLENAAYKDEIFFSPEPSSSRSKSTKSSIIELPY